MMTKDELIAQARALGEALARNEAVKAHAEAQRAVQNDAQSQELLRNYNAQAQRVQKLQTEGQPIEADDKRKLAELEQQLAGNDTIKVLMRTQADYMALMNSINQAMGAPLMRQPEAGSDA